MSRFRWLSVLAVLLLVFADAPCVFAETPAKPVSGYTYLLRLVQVAQEADLYIDSGNNDTRGFDGSDSFYIAFGDTIVSAWTEKTSSLIDHITIYMNGSVLPRALAVAMVNTSLFDYFEDFTVPDDQALENLKKDALATYETIIKTLEAEPFYVDDTYKYFWEPNLSHPEIINFRIELLPAPTK